MGGFVTLDFDKWSVSTTDGFRITFSVLDIVVVAVLIVVLENRSVVENELCN